MHKEDKIMMLTGVEYVFWVYYRQWWWTKDKVECCFSKEDARRLVERLNAEGYATRVEQQIA